MSLRGGHTHEKHWNILVSVSVALFRPFADGRELASRAELLAAGVPRNAIGRAVAKGVLVVVHPNLYGLSGRPLSRRGAIAAAEVRVLGGRYRIDFVLAGGLGVEVLGYRWHSSPEALASDTARSNRLLIAGRHTLQFTWFDIVSRPGHVVATVVAAQRARAPQGGL